MRIPFLVLSLIFLAACQQDAGPTTTDTTDGTTVQTSTTARSDGDTPVQTAPVDGDDDTTVQATSAKPAPDFTLPDTKGGTHTLSDFRGQYVILEWLNYDCPFVRKHYEGENMQPTQGRWTEAGAVWLAIVSSAPGQQGHFPNDVMNRRSEEHGGRQTAILMDEDGQVGRAFGARTTPQMVVISPEGEILYNGAIDNRPTRNRADIEGATNYVNQVMEEALAGRPISVSATQPYGCPVRYAR